MGSHFKGDSSTFFCVYLSLLLVPSLDDRSCDASWNINLERMTLLFGYVVDLVPNDYNKERP